MLMLYGIILFLKNAKGIVIETKVQNLTRDSTSIIILPYYGLNKYCFNKQWINNSICISILHTDPHPNY